MCYWVNNEETQSLMPVWRWRAWRMMSSHHGSAFFCRWTARVRLLTCTSSTQAPNASAFLFLTRNRRFSTVRVCAAALAPTVFPPFSTTIPNKVKQELCFSWDFSWAKVMLRFYTGLKCLSGGRGSAVRWGAALWRWWRRKRFEGQRTWWREEERGFSGLGSGQMAKEWRRWPADSAASTGRNAFLFSALSQSEETQTSAVKQWIKSHIPPIISL